MAPDYFSGMINDFICILNIRNQRQEGNCKTNSISYVPSAQSILFRTQWTALSVMKAGEELTFFSFERRLRSRENFNLSASLQIRSFFCTSAILRLQ
jgi:hypothetical protein